MSRGWGHGEATLELARGFPPLGPQQALQLRTQNCSMGCGLLVGMEKSGKQGPGQASPMGSPSQGREPAGSRMADPSERIWAKVSDQKSTIFEQFPLSPSHAHPAPGLCPPQCRSNGPFYLLQHL